MNHPEEYLAPEKAEVFIPDDYGAIAPTDGNWSEMDAAIAETNPDLIFHGEDEAIKSEAQFAGIKLQEAAHKRGKPMQDPKWWDLPVDLHADRDRSQLDLIGAMKDNPLVRSAIAISKSVQFPVSTAFIHGCGVFSASLIRKFSYSMFDSSQHIGLYTAAAQPPGAGKTAVHNYFANPIIFHVDQMNKGSEKERLTAKMALSKAEKLMEKAKEPSEMDEAADRLIRAREKYEALRPYDIGHTDATPEGLERVAQQQEGRFAIFTDEGEGATVVFGSNYGNGPANLGVMLKGWDGGHQKTARVSREGYSGCLYGAVAVLAQPQTINAILNAGRSDLGSRGVCERFWLIDEPNMLGEKNSRNYVGVPDMVRKEYRDLVSNVVNEQMPVNLKLSESAQNYLMDIGAGYQPMVADGGRYSDDLMRSVVTKHQAQICKMACTLHVAREWAKPEGNRSYIVEQVDVLHAARMYTQMIKGFVAAAEENNVGGNMPAVRAAAEKLISYTKDLREPRTEVLIQKFCNDIRGKSVFKVSGGLQKFIRENIIPELTAYGYIVYDSEKKTIFINPRVRKLA